MGDRDRDSERNRDSRDRRDGEGGGGRRNDRGRDDGRDTTSLLVRNLSFRVTIEDIKRLMGKYGDVRDVYLPLV
jgi:hypothetical protein